MRRIQGSLGKTAGTSEVSAQRMTKAFKTIGIGAGIAAAGIAGLIILDRTTVAAGEFGKAIAEVSTLTDEATFSTAEMEKITRSLALQFGAKTQGQARALYQIVSAGATTAEEATSLMVATNKLAIGGVTDLKTAADGLTTALNVYAAAGITAEEASDALFTAVRLGKTTVGELSETMGRVLPTANALGISFEEMLAAVSAVTLGGLKTSEAVTGLKAALAGVQKPTKDATTEAKRLGIQFDAATLRAKGLNRFMLDVMESSGFTEDSFTKLFGSIEGLNAITSLATSGGAKFNEILAAMGEKSGATEAAVAKMSKTLEFARERFGRAREDLVLTIGKAVEPFKVAVLDLGRRIFEAFTAIPEPVKKFGVLLLGLASSAAVVVGGIIAVKGAIAALGAIGIVALAPVLLLAGKIILVVGALVAVALVLRKAWVTNFLGIQNIVAGFVEGLRSLWDFIVTMLRPAWDEFTEAIRVLRNAVVEALADLGLFPEVGEAAGGSLKSLGKIIFGVFTVGIRIATFFIKIFLTVQAVVVRVVAAIVKMIGWLIKYSPLGLLIGLISGATKAGPEGRPVAVPARPEAAEAPAYAAPPAMPAAAAFERLAAERAPEEAAPARAGAFEFHTHVNVDGDRVVDAVERKREDDRLRRGELSPQFAR